MKAYLIGNTMNSTKNTAANGFSKIAQRNVCIEQF